MYMKKCLFASKKYEIGARRRVKRVEIVKRILTKYVMLSEYGT